jgi:hypothetical protein
VARRSCRKRAGVKREGLDGILAVQRRSYASAGAGIRSSWPEADALDREGVESLFADVIWASIVVTDGHRGSGHRALTAEGPVTLHEEGAFDLARERLDEGWARRHGKPSTWAVAFIELRPERIFSYGGESA